MGMRVVKLPDIGEGVAEAEIVEWHVAVGDLVAEDQMLAAVMTDKATVEIPAPCAGRVIALGADVGALMAVGGELVRLEIAGADGPAESVAASPSAETASRTTTTRAAAPSSLAPQPIAQPAAPPHQPISSPAARATKASDAANLPGRSRAPLGPPRPVGEKPLASPAVRQRALDAGIDLRQVRGSGPAGRILHDDIDLFIRDGAPAPAAGNGKRPNTIVEDIKVVGMRRRIAQNMAESKRRIAHFSYVEEMDVSDLEDLRTSLNAQHAQHRGKLTLLPFIVQALVRSISDFPQMNARYDDEAEIIQRFGGVHVGIATQTPNGLMVPVVRHAEARDLWDLASEVARLADAARKGLAAREELAGSTITVTSLGALGGIASTPVINRPEVAIIGINKQVIRPVWQGNQFVPRKMMNLSSSFDHRVIDGYDAASFIQRIKGFLEEPATMFI
ncbi:MAG TPA: dihydrolipoamide acetyltransferase family protein [Terriglobales bacterium]|nr:dihydrolipoamide acetyltransferase family protein [Terriglobales bacterium]